MVTEKMANYAVTDAKTFDGGSGQGTIASGTFGVTKGRVLMIAAGFLDRPATNPSNHGFIRFSLKYNGLTVKSMTASYDDQSGYGVTMVHEFELGVSQNYNFSFHADPAPVQPGPSLWSMLPGSTLTLINLKK